MGTDDDLLAFICIHLRYLWISVLASALKLHVFANFAPSLLGIGS